MIDWSHIRKIRKYNLNGIMLLGQVREGSVLISTQAFSFKYKKFSLSLYHSMPPFLTEAFSLYSSILLNPSLPLVDYVGDLLNACPIRTFLGTLCVAIRLNITVQTLFPHKINSN